jgi:hypothetical protein
MDRMARLLAVALAAASLLALGVAAASADGPTASTTR